MPNTSPKLPPGGQPAGARTAAQTGALSLLWLLPYTLVAAAAFLALALLALLLLLVVPTLDGRRSVTRATGRCALALMGMPVTVRWRGELPAHCIVVANHCSYLDGVVLAATLPPRFGFVIKREMSRVPLAGLLLARIGSYFVERGNRAGSARDALRVMRDAASGSSLAFFPEGTFRVEPGLLRFHTGAFAAAERAQVPVVPLVIRGTRHCLRPGGLLLRPGRIEVQVLESILPQPAHEDGAAALRDAARAAILAALGEEENT